MGPQWPLLLAHFAVTIIKPLKTPLKAVYSTLPLPQPLLATV